MNSFIHTFSFRKNITYDENCKIIERYNSSIISKDSIYYINQYSNNGVRLYITDRSKNEVKYDKNHFIKKMEIIITPYKLCHTGEAMGCVKDYKEMTAAVKKLYDILDSMSMETGVDFNNNITLSRIDITHDVFTPNAFYSDEIIRISKLSKLKHGYKFWIKPDKGHYKNIFEDKYITSYANNHQGIAAKIYNKSHELESKGISNKCENSNIVRFEVSLKKKFLKNNKYLQYLEKGIPLEHILWCITQNADNFLQKYISDVMPSGHMLSHEKLTEYIFNVCGKKIKRAKKMLCYSMLFTNKKALDSYGSKKMLAKVKLYFEKIGVSPIYLNNSCDFIPSFKALITDDYIYDDKEYKNPMI